MDTDLTGALADDVDGAFPDLVRAHARLVWTVLARAGAGGEVEDLAQEVFVRAHRALHGYDADRRRALAVRSWLVTLALNIARNAARSATRRPRTVGLGTVAEPSDPGEAPEAAALRSATRARLATALAALPPAQRAAVVLRHVLGLPYAEAAAALGLPVGTVKAQVSRGVSALRADLGATGEREELG
ncbi:MAG TPA: RNA polymerase sigma factor [Mycobacteriales bacterium]|nr:RNA polymerase sigma factor [Mycobacteriales bacterium]